MLISSGIKNVVSGILLAVLLAFCLSASAYAESAVTFTQGTVFVEDDGTVGVTVRDPRGDPEYYIPSNGAGLLRSGQIEDGDEVDVKIVHDRGHKHRGHVTVLK